MFNHSIPSIEEFAAFLDGNLSQSEMHQFSQFAEKDVTLHQLLDANSVVDESLNGFTDAELQLPSDLVGAGFELPTISFEDVSTLVSLLPEPEDDMLVAACSDDDVSMFSGIDQYNHTNTVDDMHDDSSLATSGDDGFGYSDDSSDTFSDNI